MDTLNGAPPVIPSLQEWAGGMGQFTITPYSCLVVDSAHVLHLLETAQAFQEDFHRITSHPLPLVTAPMPGHDDIFLTLEDPGHVGDQGYTLDVADRVTIRAATATGAFYGAQTVLQLLYQDPAHAHLPRGKARDYPQFPQRAVMLDAGRRYWHMDYLRELMWHMQWLKLNVLHLHLTEWSAFRLHSDLHPGLAADRAYSKADVAALQALARRYHVTLVPEIDLPAHATAITRYDPTLAFKSESMSYARWPGGELGGWTLDYTDPGARQWMRELLGEFISLFDGPYFHVGADEVPEQEELTQSPELAAYAQARGYPYPGDVLVEWINEVNDFVKSRGKRTQVWGWWERSPHSIEPARDIVVNAWVGQGDPAIFLEAGYQVVGSPESTHYLSPGLGLLPENEYLYQEWVPLSHPRMLGYKICVWADGTEGEPDAFFERRLRLPRAILAERTWCGAVPSRPLTSFLELLDRIDP